MVSLVGIQTGESGLFNIFLNLWILWERFMSNKRWKHRPLGSN
jgi:hypothetical protein